MSRKKDLGFEDIVDVLDNVTGLTWNLPPERPSFLRNGFHAEVPMIEAPYIVRQLQQAAIAGTGRQRAIVFDAYGRGRAMINLPKEIALSEGFQMALSRSKPATRAFPPSAQAHPGAFPATTH